MPETLKKASFDPARTDFTKLVQKGFVPLHVPIERTFIRAAREVREVQLKNFVKSFQGLGVSSLNSYPYFI